MECLVVCVFQKNGKSEIIDAHCSFEHNPPTFKDVKEVLGKIESSYGIENACIINWLPLSEMANKVREKI